MINDNLKQKILPHLKRRLYKRTKEEIEWMFGEAYETTEDGITYVTIRPPADTTLGGFQFNKLTGAFHTVVNWRDIRRYGKRL